MKDFKLHLPGCLLCRISPRFHLRMICRAIGLEPYVWQRAFALGRIHSLPGKREHGNGKTTAVMLRLLMLPAHAQPSEAARILAKDPEWFVGCNRARRYWFARKYHRLQLECDLARVPVSHLSTIDTFRI